MDRDSKILINLESLLALGAKLNETSDEISILNITLLSLMGKLKIFRGIIFTHDSTNEYFIPVISKGKKNISKIKAFEIKQICIIKDKGSDNELLKAGYEICIPILYRNELLAVICLSKKLDTNEMTEEEFYYASLVSSITANALKNTKNINLLLKEKYLVESKNQLLTTLFEVSRDFNVFLSEEKIIKTLSLNLSGQLMITRFAVIYLEESIEEEDRINKKNNLSKTSNLKILKSTLKEAPSLNIITELLTIDQTCFIEELAVGEELDNWLTKNEVCVVSPMMTQSAIKGFLLIGKSTVGRQFTEENLLFIKVIGNTTVLALENLKLIQKEVERQKLENELSIALEIQRNLLPDENPEIKGFDIYGTSIPSKFVGGDYYDFIKLSNGNLLIAIADVSGKGMPAALLMANVQAALRVLGPLDISLPQLIFRLNNLVYHNTTADRFVTFFCGELNPVDRTFKYINAGHNPPLYIKSNGDVELLTLGGIILGVIENTDNYKTGEIKLNQGESITFFTDGITEATNKNLDEYGEKRLIEMIQKSKSGNSNELVKNILTDVKNHSKSFTQKDDITIVTLKVIEYTS